jgi:hypothetical protein
MCCPNLYSGDASTKAKAANHETTRWPVTNLNVYIVNLRRQLNFPSHLAIFFNQLLTYYDGTTLTENYGKSATKHCELEAHKKKGRPHQSTTAQNLASTRYGDYVAHASLPPLNVEASQYLHAAASPCPRRRRAGKPERRRQEGKQQRQPWDRDGEKNTRIPSGLGTTLTR